LPIINLIITVALSVGGVLAYKQGMAKTANEIQQRVINALNEEINTLKDRINSLEKETKKLRGFIATIKVLLKQRSLSLTIDGDTVILHDEKSNSSIVNVGEEEQKGS